MKSFRYRFKPLALNSSTQQEGPLPTVPGWERETILFTFFLDLNSIFSSFMTLSPDVDVPASPVSIVNPNSSLIEFFIFKKKEFFISGDHPRVKPLILFTYYGLLISL